MSPRFAAAAIEEPTPGIGEVLLCYRANAKKIQGPEGTLATNLPGGTRIRQSKHEKRSALRLSVGNGIPAPFEIDTKTSDVLCLPTEVRSIQPE